MPIPTATLSSKYQISIPKEIRDSMNLKPGQKLAFLCIGKSVSLMPQPRLEDLFGIGKGGDPTGYRDRNTRREDTFQKVNVPARDMRQSRLPQPVDKAAVKAVAKPVSKPASKSRRSVAA